MHLEDLSHAGFLEAKEKARDGRSNVRRLRRVCGAAAVQGTRGFRKAATIWTIWKKTANNNVSHSTDLVIRDVGLFNSHV